MSLAGWHNGIPIDDPACVVPVDDRGFNYGDGLFETTRLCDGKVRFLDAHLQRLREGCGRLGIVFPSELAADIAAVSAAHREGVLKIVVTRGAGGRGYRPSPEAGANRTLTLHPAPPQDQSGGLMLRWCDMRLSRNPALAGMKHLNRLEEVLAQHEWHDAMIDEGLLCDTEGELVSATAGNVFVVKGGVLMTPDLRFCGVRGVMRAQVLRAAQELGLTVSEEPLWPHDVAEASEVFLTNAVRGIRPVSGLLDQRWESFLLAGQLSRVLGL